MEGLFVSTQNEVLASLDIVQTQKQKVDGSDLSETHRNDYFMTVGHEKGEKMY